MVEKESATSRTLYTVGFVGALTIADFDPITVLLAVIDRLVQLALHGLHVKPGPRGNWIKFLDTRDSDTVFELEHALEMRRSRFSHFLSDDSVISVVFKPAGEVFFGGSVVVQCSNPKTSLCHFDAK